MACVVQCRYTMPKLQTQVLAARLRMSAHAHQNENRTAVDGGPGHWQHAFQRAFLCPALAPHVQS